MSELWEGTRQVLRAFFGFILFISIGSLFSWWFGLLAGLYGAYLGLTYNPEAEKKQKAETAKKVEKLKEKEKAERDRKLKEKEKERAESLKLALQKAEIKNRAIYVEVVIDLIAACIISDATIEESEIDLATSFIESDSEISDKKGALEKLQVSIEGFHQEIIKSKALFNLKVTTLMHQLKKVNPGLHTEKIVVILEGLAVEIRDGNRQETEKFVVKVKGVISDIFKSTPEQLVAEQYILDSGDEEAIKSLADMKKDPGTYKEKLKHASKDNSIMRTALGVFTGVIAANLVTGAIHQYQMSEALSNFEAELADLGGVDNFQFDQESNVYSASLDTVSEATPLGEVEETEVLSGECGDTAIDEDVEEADDIEASEGSDSEDDFDFFA